MGNSTSIDQNRIGDNIKGKTEEFIREAEKRVASLSQKQGTNQLNVEKLKYDILKLKSNLNSLGNVKIAIIGRNHTGINLVNSLYLTSENDSYNTIYCSSSFANKSSKNISGYFDCSELNPEISKLVSDIGKEIVEDDFKIRNKKLHLVSCKTSETLYQYPIIINNKPLLSLQGRQSRQEDEPDFNLDINEINRILYYLNTNDIVIYTIEANDVEIEVKFLDFITKNYDILARLVEQNQFFVVVDQLFKFNFANSERFSKFEKLLSLSQRKFIFHVNLDKAFKDKIIYFHRNLEYSLLGSGLKDDFTPEEVEFIRERYDYFMSEKWRKKIDKLPKYKLVRPKKRELQDTFPDGTKKTKEQIENEKNEIKKEEEEWDKRERNLQLQQEREYENQLKNEEIIASKEFNNRSNIREFEEVLVASIISTINNQLSFLKSDLIFKLNFEENRGTLFSEESIQKKAIDIKDSIHTKIQESFEKLKSIYEADKYAILNSNIYVAGKAEEKAIAFKKACEEESPFFCWSEMFDFSGDNHKLNKFNDELNKLYFSYTTPNFLKFSQISNKMMKQIDLTERIVQQKYGSIVLEIESGILERELRDEPTVRKTEEGKLDIQTVLKFKLKKTNFFTLLLYNNIYVKKMNLTRDSSYYLLGHLFSVIGSIFGVIQLFLTKDKKIGDKLFSLGISATSIVFGVVLSGYLNKVYNQSSKARYLKNSDLFKKSLESSREKIENFPNTIDQLKNSFEEKSLELIKFLE